MTYKEYIPYTEYDMASVEMKLHRMSPSQLKALFLLANSQGGIISSTESGRKLGIEGKSLAGVFSSLSRQHIGKQYFILPWGKAENGRGLRWKLNEKVISQKDLLKNVSEVLRTYS